jgi:alpha-L-fucosidase
VRAVGKSVEGDDLRFTRKGSDLYVTVLGNPKGKTLTIVDLHAVPGGKVTAVGVAGPLRLESASADLKIELPAKLEGKYAYVFKLGGYARN